MAHTIARNGTAEKACWNTFGKVMNISEGPEPGFIPTENAAGKMIMPARIATKVSIIPTLIAVWPSRVSLPKYEA